MSDHHDSAIDALESAAISLGGLNHELRLAAEDARLQLEMDLRRYLKAELAFVVWRIYAKSKAKKKLVESINASSSKRETSKAVSVACALFNDGRYQECADELRDLQSQLQTSRSIYYSAFEQAENRASQLAAAGYWGIFTKMPKYPEALRECDSLISALGVTIQYVSSLLAYYPAPPWHHNT